MEKFCELIKGKEPVFVLFYATWCPHCHKMLPIVEKLKGHKGLHVVKFDIDDERNKMLLNYFQVQAVPLMMIYSEGEQLWKWNGEIEETELMQTLKRLVNK